MITEQEAKQKLQALLASEGKSEHTIRAYLSDVGEFYLTLPHDPNQATLNVLAFAWIKQTRSRVAPATTNRRLASMRALGRAFNVPVLKEYKGPTVGRRPAHPLPEGMDDVRRVLAVCETDDHRALVVLVGYCGLRVSEARSIVPLSFADNGKGEITLYVRGKGDKERFVPVAPVAWTILSAIIMKHEAGPLVNLSDRGARVALTRLGKKAGLSRDIASHDFRMTFGSTVYNGSKDLRVTQELLGHASPNTTMGYTLIDDDAKRAAVTGAIT